MNQKKLRILNDDVTRRFLPFVRKPGRYIGGEINQVKKDLSACDVRIAICFPDMYEIGMSYTGLSILYSILNQIQDVAAERIFALWMDAEQILRNEKIPLFTLESRAAVADFDIVAFSLTNELCYTNMLNVLDLAGIPIRSEDRTEEHPLIIAGGQASNCAEPVAPFVDMFVLGDGEEIIVQLADLYKSHKLKSTGDREFLIDAARKYSCVYVPSLYSKEDKDNTVLKPDVDGLPTEFTNAVVNNLDNAHIPQQAIVPFTEAVHERISVEVMRGCPGRCRFCQASYCRRPIRYRSVNTIVDAAKAQYRATGFDTVSLLSLSTADYPHLEELVDKLQEYFTPLHVGISLPSLKVQTQLKLLPKLVSTVRKGGLTIAVEAASEKLRRVINKPISDDDLFTAVESAYKAGYQLIKLYFMVGFPGETPEDITRIVDLSYKISSLRKKVDGKLANINAAVSWLVPKPHTPFAWLGQKPAEYFEEAKRMMLDRKRQLRAKFIQLKFHDINTSVLEAAIGRGGRNCGQVVETAWENGAKFDLWRECFNFQIWEDAFKQHGLDIHQQAQRSFNQEDHLPWQHLGSPGIDNLRRHYSDALETAGD